jgi:hypothetical protein
MGLAPPFRPMVHFHPRAVQLQMLRTCSSTPLTSGARVPAAWLRTRLAPTSDADWWTPVAALSSRTQRYPQNSPARGAGIVATTTAILGTESSGAGFLIYKVSAPIPRLSPIYTPPPYITARE